MDDEGVEGNNADKANNMHTSNLDAVRAHFLGNEGHIGDAAGCTGEKSGHDIQME